MLRSTLIFAALISAVAHAEYSNHSLGIGPHLTVVTGSRSLMWGLALEGSNYLENGFELFARVPLLIAEPIAGETARVFSTGGNVGVRYLFVEGTVQPWVGLQLSGVVLITQPVVNWFLGAGATIGLDWVLSESWSIGARGIYDVFVRLDGPWRHQLGGSLVGSVVF
jgi:hypothetical protein